MGTDRKTIFLILLLGSVLATGCSRTSFAPTISTKPKPVICDFTQFANKPPEFVKNAFPNRQWSMSTLQHWDHTIKRPVTILDSAGFLPNTPYIGAYFYDGKLFEVMVFFWDDISPEEAARRVGLPVSSFRVIAPETAGNRVVRLKGLYKGVDFRELDITDHPYTNGIGSRNVIAMFSVPGVTKS